MDDLSRYKILLASELLDKAADQFGNHGSNDFDLADTPITRQLLVDMEEWNDGEKHTWEDLGETPYDGTISTMDWYLMRYLAHFLLSLAPAE